MKLPTSEGKHCERARTYREFCCGLEGGRSLSYRLLRLVGSACDQAICNAAFKSALLSFDSVPVVAPRLPQAFGTGAKACGSSTHLKSCSSGVNMKFAVLPSAASVT